MKMSRILVPMLMAMGLTLSATNASADTIQRLNASSDNAESIQRLGSSNSTQDGVIDTLSNRDMERFLDEYTGGNYEDLGDGAYKFQMLGCGVIVFNKGINMQLYSGYVMDTVSYRDINDWNAGKRFSRAYLDHDEDPILESDLDLEGGSSMGAVREFFRTYEMSLGAFTDHIGWEGCGR